MIHTVSSDVKAGLGDRRGRSFLVLNGVLTTRGVAKAIGRGYKLIRQASLQVFGRKPQCQPTGLLVTLFGDR
jgi:hypothetical protein